MLFELCAHFVFCNVTFGFVNFCLFVSVKCLHGLRFVHSSDVFVSCVDICLYVCMFRVL